MAEDLTTLKAPSLTLPVTGPRQKTSAADAAKKFAVSLGFSQVEAEEIALAASELASNLIKHAGGGELQLSAVESFERKGMQIVSQDGGPGIAEVEVALSDGFSTAGTLGKGLGAVNRLMDELDFSPREQAGLRIVCRRWLRPAARAALGQWLEFGAATRACRWLPENGDAFVIRQWQGHALAGVIDGLGHGPLAQRASQAARHYLEHHFDQPLENLFRGVDRVCRATRGVVMALARFDQNRNRFTVASVGNIELRLVGGVGPFNPVVRRGIVGLSTAPEPVPTEHLWSASAVLIIYSDGISSRWTTQELEPLVSQAAGIIARRLLDRHGRLDDDATVLVIKNRKS
jgi:anti-sigma regulatory factor (Ser/Thr protein kinase)/serine/threonine protein phosphatase PrpC